jgi:hypothetical protein
MKISPIIPVAKKEITESPECVYELKLDGFRGLADTINGRMLSKNLHPFKRFQHLLDDLPVGCVFDGEICASFVRSWHFDPGMPQSKPPAKEEEGETEVEVVFKKKTSNKAADPDAWRGIIAAQEQARKERIEKQRQAWLAATTNR